ncbi:FecR family protein [Xanthomonas bundabergensis]|uniref:FecR family protein n=1 Tax=Xanthomonas bundabergensis TaxID=3160842 RepID=UPI003515F572
MPDTPSVDDDLFDQAVHWILRLDAAPGDADSVRQYRDWLAVAPAAQAVAAARALLGMLQRPAAEVGDELGIDPLQPAPSPATAIAATAAAVAQRRPRRQRRRWQAVAAGLALAIGAGTWLGAGGLDRLRSDAYTEVGAMRRLQLQDGSVVTLNTDSAIAVRMHDGVRSVRLLRGEAFFQVARDPRRPFVVDSAGGSARVLGTTFNVHLDAAAAQVSVVEGRVAVRPPAGGTGTVLVAGQSAWLAGESVRREPAVDPLAVAAWRRRQLVFYNTPLSQVVRELSRYRHGFIQLRGDIGALPVSGAFNVADPDAGLQVLLDSLQLDAVRLGWATFVYRPASAAHPSKVNKT